MRDYRLYLKDILAAKQFVAGMDLKTFQADDKTASAVIRKFEIIGEAVKQLPEEIRKAYPEVPYRLIHFYFGVNYRLVWRTIKEDLPRVKPHLQRILEQIQ